MSYTKSCALVLFLSGSASLCAGAFAQATHITIGTASVAGAYFPAGGHICNYFNRDRAKYKYTARCSVEATGGSTANARAMKAGDLDVALMQSDTAYNAAKGLGEFSNLGPNENLRFVLSLHPDVFHIVTKDKKSVKTILDLKGKTVNTGSPGTGSETALYSALKLYGLSPQTLFGRETKLTPREHGSALCDGKIDAYVFATGLGSASIVEPTTVCGATVWGWWDDTIAKLIADTPFLNAVTVPKGTYEGQTEDLKTWGNTTVLVVSSKLPDDVVYYLTKAVFDNLDEFKQQHASFRTMTPADSAKNGQVIPYHPGALKFLRGVKLVN